MLQIATVSLTWIDFTLKCCCFEPSVIVFDIKQLCFSIYIKEGHQNWLNKGVKLDIIFNLGSFVLKFGNGCIRSTFQNRKCRGNRKWCKRGPIPFAQSEHLLVSSQLFSELVSLNLSLGLLKSLEDWFLFKFVSCPFHCFLTFMNFQSKATMFTFFFFFLLNKA